MSSLILRGRIPAGFYPERRAPEEGPVDRWADAALSRLWRLRRPRLSRFRASVDEVNRLGGPLTTLGEQELQWQIRDLRGEIRAHGFDQGTVPRTFALVREVATRRLEMRHFDVQILGGYALLQGMVAEMNAGEGKTLTATLPACAMGLAGIPVHIITVNDYLAKRDSEWMKPIYHAFGLSVGCVVQGAGLDERREAYACDITYCTNKEIVFDYLRDRLV